jgi:hypothetical protein
MAAKVTALLLFLLRHTWAFSKTMIEEGSIIGLRGSAAAAKIRFLYDVPHFTPGRRGQRQ